MDKGTSLPCLSYRFYLDYVGCKGRQHCGCSSAQHGFISTMWDVKAEDIKQKVTKLLRFISTMWDVKFPNLTYSPFSLLRFISTMWDVKYDYSVQSAIERLAFYLDYVGCKGK